MLRNIIIKMKIGDKVVKNNKYWMASDFDWWGAGIGIGKIVQIDIDEDDKLILDIKWPYGRCFNMSHEIINISMRKRKIERILK